MQSTPKPVLKSSEVFAGAYSRLDNTLTHGVELGVDGFAVRVMCKRVKLDSVCATQDSCMVSDEPPTCPTCARRWARETK